MNSKGFRSKGRVLIFKVLSRHLPGRTEDHENLSQDSRSPGLYLNPGPPEYEAGGLTTRPRLSVAYITTHANLLM
jgi:hypothetical protein